MSAQSTSTVSNNSDNSLFDSNFSEQIADSAQSTQPLAESSTTRNNLSEGDLATAILTLRSLISTREAGAIIGKGGKTISDLCEHTGVKAGVSKSASGLQERILTVSGTLENISKAYASVASTILEASFLAANPNDFNQQAANSSFSFAVIRLLISHHQMGPIIGRQGMKIKRIQESCKVRMVASKQFLPNSTERIVEVQGRPDAIQAAIWDIGNTLLEETDPNTSIIFYNPQPGPSSIFNNNNQNVRYNNNNGNTNTRSYPNNGNPKFNSQYQQNNRGNSNNRSPNNATGAEASDDAEAEVQELSISSSMVGCIIGRGGSKISEIRQESGAKISIAKNPHNDSGDRMFTIVGSKEACEKAFKLLFSQLEAERERRALENQTEQTTM